VIANMESFNAILIEQGVPQRERLVQLNAMAKSQLRVLEKQNALKLLKEWFLSLISHEHIRNVE